MKTFSQYVIARRALSLVLCAAPLVASAQTTLPYSTSFESPEFTSGGLSGQTPLDDSATAYRIIPDASQGLTAPAIVRSGSQSLRYLNALGETGSTANLRIAASPIISATVWINIHSSDLTAFGNTINYASASSQYYGLRLGNGSDRFTSTYIALNVDGLVGGGGEMYSTTPPQLGSIGTSALNRWVEVKIDANSVTRKVSATVDGSLFNLPDLQLGTEAFTEVSILRAGDAGPRAYAFYDDFSVQPVPEPASLVALGLGVVALLKRRTR